MNDFAAIRRRRPSLIVHASPELLSIVTLSLRVSVTASPAASVPGLPSSGLANCK
jgi:hypothetical protein